MQNEHEVITEYWLRAAGFKWTQADRQPFKHWTLWIGDAIPRIREAGTSSPDNFGVELSQADNLGVCWLMWLRADYAGRYDRFLFARDVVMTSQVTSLIEALTDRPFEPRDSLYGEYRSHEQAERMRRDAERMDLRIATSRDTQP